MNELKLFTLPTCPKCRVVKMKLDAKGVHYTESQNIDEMTALGLKGTPVLKCGDNLMQDMTTINEFINSL